MPLPIRAKIILPFFVLLAFVGTAGTWIGSARLSVAATAQFDAGLLRSSVLANARLEALESDRLAQLRAATDTLGVPEAVGRGDRTTLSSLLTPIAANASTGDIELRVLDAQGHELLGVGSRASGPIGLPVVDPHLIDTTPVRAALAGRADAVGERYGFLWAGPSGATVYWVGPVWNAEHQAVGAILLGESIADMARGLAGVSLYDANGAILTSALQGPPLLTPAVRQQVTGGQAVRVMETKDGHQSATLFSPWVLRGRPIGYLGTTQNADGLTSLLAQLRYLLFGIFAAAACLTLVVGALVAWRITRPVQELVTATRKIAGGDLSYRAPVRGRDEIGSLALSFNRMAASLAQKTALLEETTFSSMQALARAIDARDPYTFGHSARVAAVSDEIAQALGLDAQQRAALRRAALLHDIGKIGIEDRILRKPSNLTDEEEGSMREHPRIGFEMLKGLRFLEASLPGVRNHHERWDGAGYPDGLAGTQIPLMVRILTVADVFDALTSERPYRRAMTAADSTSEIVREAGVRYDPDVVTAFVSRGQAIAGLVQNAERAA